MGKRRMGATATRRQFFQAVGGGALALGRWGRPGLPVLAQEVPEGFQQGEQPMDVKPTPQQLAWQEAGLSLFLHFGMNTFTDREWGEGNEDPQWFNPTELEARQWVQTAQEAGFKYLILTAKHHDGFCLGPSRYTEHSVKNSPWREGRGDVVVVQ